jgi:hypothetical protein
MDGFSQDFTRQYGTYTAMVYVFILSHGRLQPGFYKAMWHVYGFGLILLNFDSSFHGRLQPGFDKAIWHVYEIRILFSLKLIAYEISFADDNWCAQDKNHSQFYIL